MTTVDPDAAAGLAIIEVASLLEALIDEHARSVGGLSGQQYSLLRILIDAEGEVCMTDLADMAAQSRSGLTYQCRQLEEAGLIERLRAAGDERAVNIQITKQGRRAVQEITPGVSELTRAAILGQLRDSERTAFVSAVSGARDRLRARVPTVAQRRRRVPR